MSADRRREVAEWLYSTIFRDEAVQLRQQKPKDPLPPLLQAARSLETAKPNLRRSHEALFVQQAKLLENYEDDYVYEHPVVRYYPTYQFLTDQELRGYFSWRTKLRKGDLHKTSLSYAFLYIYELLNQAGVESPLDGYRKLKDFGAAYGKLDEGILPYLNRWLIDYAVYYDLDPALLADTPSVIFDSHLAVLANLDQHDSRKIMEAVVALSGRWLERSKFYGNHPEDNVIQALYLQGLFKQIQNIRFIIDNHNFMFIHPADSPFTTFRCRISSVKIKQLFKFLIQSDTQNQCQLCRRIKLPGFNGADGIPGHTYHIRKLVLGQLPFRPCFLQAVSQN